MKVPATTKVYDELIHTYQKEVNAIDAEIDRLRECRRHTRSQIVNLKRAKVRVEASHG